MYLLTGDLDRVLYIERLRSEDREFHVRYFVKSHAPLLGSIDDIVTVKKKLTEQHEKQESTFIADDFWFETLKVAWRHGQLSVRGSRTHSGGHLDPIDAAEASRLDYRGCNAVLSENPEKVIWWDLRVPLSELVILRDGVLERSETENPAGDAIDGRPPRATDADPGPTGSPPRADAEPDSADPSNVADPLAEWIVARRDHEKRCNRLLQRARTDATLGTFTKVEFLEAYGRVYETRVGHPPISGWPLRSSYRERGQ